jgi:hypothetical protein
VCKREFSRDFGAASIIARSGLSLMQGLDFIVTKRMVGEEKKTYLEKRHKDLKLPLPNVEATMTVYQVNRAFETNITRELARRYTHKDTDGEKKTDDVSGGGDGEGGVIGSVAGGRNKKMSRKRVVVADTKGGGQDGVDGTKAHGDDGNLPPPRGRVEKKARTDGMEAVKMKKQRKSAPKRAKPPSPSTSEASKKARVDTAAAEGQEQRRRRPVRKRRRVGEEGVEGDGEEDDEKKCEESACASPGVRDARDLGDSLLDRPKTLVTASTLEEAAARTTSGVRDVAPLGGRR